MRQIPSAISTLLLLCGMALSQTLDTGILGTVTDPTGAAVAGAAVTITQTATGVKRNSVTAADGKYEVRYLVPGEYTVQVTASGFRAAQATNLTLQLNQQARLDVPLQVGDVQQTVEVTAASG